MKKRGQFSANKGTTGGGERATKGGKWGCEQEKFTLQCDLPAVCDVPIIALLSLSLCGISYKKMPMQFRQVTTVRFLVRSCTP